MEAFRIRPIAPQDDAAVAAIIRTVMPEFGADGPGFAIHDPEVGHMCAAYSRPGAAYFVVEAGGRVLGGGGIAALEGGPESVCELRKMYFLPELRGLGAGEQLLRLCLVQAQRLGYARCYLETLVCMTSAQRLYEKLGFTRLQGPLGDTGHHSCDTWYARDLR